MDHNSVWPGTEYLWIPERGRGETLNKYNFHKCRRVKVYHVFKATYAYAPNRRAISLADIEQLDPITGAAVQPYTKNIRTRHIVCRWEEIEDLYAQIKKEKAEWHEEQERLRLEREEEARLRRHEWEQKQEVERQRRLELERQRTERLVGIKAYLSSTPIREEWIYSTTDMLMTIDLAKVEKAMEDHGGQVIDFPRQSS